MFTHFYKSCFQCSNTVSLHSQQASIFSAIPKLLFLILFFLSFFFKSIKARFRQELDLNPRTDPDGFHGYQGSWSWYQLTVCCEGRESAWSQPSKSAQQHNPNCPWVPQPLWRTDRQTDAAALLGLPPEDPIDRGFLAPHSRAACGGTVLSLSFCGFLNPVEVRGTQQGQAASMYRRSAEGLFLHYP